MEDYMAKVKEMLLPKDPRYLKYPLEGPFDQEKAYWTAFNCSRCSVCKWVDSWRVKSAKYARICPQHTRYLFDSHSGQGKCDLARAIIEGKMKWEDDPEIKNILFQCTMCGGCDAMDKGIRDGELVKLYRWMRSEYIKKFGPLPEHKAMIDSVKQYDNVWLQPRAKRNAWAKDLQNLGIKDLNKEKAQVLFFVGCTYGLSQELKPTILNIAKILKQNKVDFGILGDKELCCGSPPEKTGMMEEFERLGVANIKRFNELGIKTLVTPCAGCYGTIRVEYDELPVKKKFEVLHVAEYLDRLVQDKKIKYKKEVPLTVTWHDPCHMGRLGRPYVPGKDLDGVYDEPRAILKSIPGVELAEMERIKEYAWCCGGGGGAFTGFKDFAQWTARERLTEAKDTGARAIVTSCPWCESNLRAGGIGMDEKMEVKNLFDLMMEAL
jgi:Fe-S oxidoreductase